jgi:hypothetical protein
MLGAEYGNATNRANIDLELSKKAKTISRKNERA